jgi:hypothetical protein
VNKGRKIISEEQARYKKRDEVVVPNSFTPIHVGHRGEGERGEGRAPHVPPMKIFEKIPHKNAIKHDPPPPPQVPPSKEFAKTPIFVYHDTCRVTVCPTNRACEDAFKPN